jgi:hypothetical protein
MLELCINLAQKKKRKKKKKKQIGINHTQEGDGCGRQPAGQVEGKQ